MKYKYQTVDPLNAPINFGFASFEGEHFFSAFFEHRQKLFQALSLSLDHPPNGWCYPNISDDHKSWIPTINESVTRTSPFSSRKSLEELTTCHDVAVESLLPTLVERLSTETANPAYSSSLLESFTEALRRSFERKRLIFERYSIPKMQGTRPVIYPKLYCLLAFVFARKNLKDLRYLNVLMKVNDHFAVESSSTLSHSSALCAGYALLSEYSAIRQLALEGA